MAEAGEQVENTEQQQEVDPIVQQASEMGWKPKEEYDGDPSKWVSAEIYVARAPLFEKIESQSKQIKDTQKALQELKAHQTKIAAAEYKRALETLKAQRRAALQEGDLEAAEEFRDQMDDLKQQQVKPEEEIPPAFHEWKSQNSWYDSDEDMRDFADIKGAKFAKDFPNDPEKVLEKVSEAVKKAFPDKFKKPVNPNREKAPSVEGDSAPVGTATGKGFKLTEDEERVAARFERQGIMSRADYIKQIKSIRG